MYNTLTRQQLCDEKWIVFFLNTNKWLPYGLKKCQRGLADMVAFVIVHRGNRLHKVS